MHLPDGFLDAKTALICTGAAAVGVGIGLRQVRTSLEPRKMPMLGLAAAFVFAAQMLNFPVAGGTSGHLLGAVLTAILLGPSAAVLVMACVLIVQCLMFADGGLMALGANIFNMGIVSSVSGYFVFRMAKGLIRMEETRSTVFAAAFASWFGTVLASVFCAGELAVSNSVAWPIAFAGMANIHMIIGCGEGVATALVILAVVRRRPELINVAESSPAMRRTLLGHGLLVSLGLAIFVAPFASPWPDALEQAARAFGIETKLAGSSVSAPLAEYRLPFVGSATLATAMAGAIGTVLAFIAAYGLARMLVPVLGARKKDASSGN